MENLILKELEEEIINNIPLVLLTIVFQYSSSLRFIPCSYQLNRCPFVVAHNSQIYFLKSDEKNPEYCRIISLSMDTSHTCVSKFEIFENDIFGMIYHQNCIYIGTPRAIYRCPENLQILTVLCEKSDLNSIEHFCIDTKRNQLISIGHFDFNDAWSFYVYDLTTCTGVLYNIFNKVDCAYDLFYDERNDDILLLTPSKCGFVIRFFEPYPLKKKKKLNISYKISPDCTILSPKSLFYNYGYRDDEISVFTRDGTQKEKICLLPHHVFLTQFNSHIKFNYSPIIAYHNHPLFPELILFDHHKNAFVAMGICQSVS